jgi:hypothetical protein
MQRSAPFSEKKAMVQNRKTRGKGRWTITDHDIEVVRCFRYLGTGISSTNDATEEIMVGIAATNRAYCSLQTVFMSAQMHQTRK